jgi:spore coat polysaccharide biosynthesis protein SpsF
MDNLIKQKNIDIIVQARTGSSRLPNKIMKYLEDKLVLDHVIERLQKSKYARQVVICTSNKEEDNVIYEHCYKNNVKCFRGSELNVLERYYETATFFKSDYILRVTSDCPLVDAYYLDLLIEKYFELNQQYLGPKYYGNHKFPDGFNGEVFNYNVLKEAYENASENEKEHVTSYIIKKYKTTEFDYPIEYLKYKNINFSHLHLSLDTAEDYELLKNIFQYVYLQKNNFKIEDVLDYLDQKNLY